jgi:hypothetical protein
MTTVELVNGFKLEEEIIEEETANEYNLTIIKEIKEDLKYDRCYHFYNGHAKVAINNKYGLINKQGKEIIPCIFNEVSSVINNTIVAIGEDQDYFYDKDGYLITNKKYYDCLPFSDNRGGFRDPETLSCGYIDQYGNEVIEPQFEEVRPFFNGYATVLHKDKLKYGLIDVNGNTIIDFNYMDLKIVNDGLIAAQSSKTKKWGYIDLQENVIIPFKYDYASTVEEDKAIVRKNDKQFIINLRNKTVDSISINIIEKEEDLIFGTLDYYPHSYFDKVFFIKTDIPKPKKNEPFFIVSDDNGKYALKNKEKKIISDFIFDHVDGHVYDDVVIGQSNGKETHVTQDGHFLGLNDKIVYQKNGEIKVTDKYYGVRLSDNETKWFNKYEEREEFLKKNQSYKLATFVKTYKLN